MEKIYLKKETKLDNLCNRPQIDTTQLTTIVKEVFDEVKRNGDDALIDYTQVFDKVELVNLLVSEKEIEFASDEIGNELKQAIKTAYQNIYKFHEKQKFVGKKIVTKEGVECWQETRPIEKVGIYIPGGSAPLFSTVLMLGIPAVIAGCKEIVLCTPPNKKASVHPAILYTAKLIGIKKIIKVGGIQAIAALSIGTESIPKVNKIFGPGNQYVTMAKQYAQNLGVAIDMPAGPSEVLVVADETANPAFVATDLLSQAEHGVDSQVICLVYDDDIYQKVLENLNTQKENLPRKEIIIRALENAKFVISSDKQKNSQFINEYAPEHLILSTKDNNFYVENILNAGSVFIGNYAPESAGDYASGTNHTLPTNGAAKAYSGVSLDSFTKKISFQRISKEGIQQIGKSIEIMADAEGLMAHKNAVTLRLNEN